MKRLFLILILFGIQLQTWAQLKSEVNECFELTSIACRLAGYDEYTQCMVTQYATNTDRYFGKFDNKKMTDYLVELRQKQAIGYDAVPMATELLEIKNGGVAIRKNADIAALIKRDPRWTEESFKKFTSMINDFYKKTKFNKFFVSQDSIYKDATTKLDQILEKINLEWFETFYGKGLDRPFVYVSPNNGPSNYAIGSIDGQVGMLLGCHAFEGEIYVSRYAPSTVIHEFSHHLSNPVTLAHWDQLQAAADSIYPAVAQQLRKIAYGSARTMMIEWLNRLFTICYQVQNGADKWQIAIYTYEEHEDGFICMERSMQFMSHFFADREKYKTINDFMPRLVEFVDYTADNVGEVITEFANRRPYIVETFPVNGGTLPLDTDSIIIRFSEPMMTSAQGYRPLKDDQIKFIPLSASTLTKTKWINDQTFVLHIDRSKLERGKRYGFQFSSDYTISSRYYRIDPEKTKIIFTTPK